MNEVAGGTLLEQYDVLIDRLQLLWKCCRDASRDIDLSPDVRKLREASELLTKARVATSEILAVANGFLLPVDMPIVLGNIVRQIYRTLAIIGKRYNFKKLRSTMEATLTTDQLKSCVDTGELERAVLQIDLTSKWRRTVNYLKKGVETAIEAASAFAKAWRLAMDLLLWREYNSLLSSVFDVDPLLHRLFVDLKAQSLAPNIADQYGKLRVSMDACNSKVQNYEELSKAISIKAGEAFQAAADLLQGLDSSADPEVAKDMVTQCHEQFKKAKFTILRYLEERLQDRFIAGIPLKRVGCFPTSRESTPVSAHATTAPPSIPALRVNVADSMPGSSPNSPVASLGPSESNEKNQTLYSSVVTSASSAFKRFFRFGSSAS